MLKEEKYKVQDRSHLLLIWTSLHKTLQIVQDLGEICFCYLLWPFKSLFCASGTQCHLLLCNPFIPSPQQAPGGGTCLLAPRAWLCYYCLDTNCRYFIQSSCNLPGYLPVPQIFDENHLCYIYCLFQCSAECLLGFEFHLFSIVLGVHSDFDHFRVFNCCLRAGVHFFSSCWVIFIALA